MTFEEWLSKDEGVSRFGFELRPEWVDAARAGWEAGVATEREACAALADAQRHNTNFLLSFPSQSSAAYEIAAAIRARSIK